MAKICIGKHAVSDIILGTSNFGSQVDPQTAVAIMDRFFERGGDAIDTARVYGAIGGSSLGAAERILGTYMEDNRLRDKIFLMTKGCFPELSDYTVPRLCADVLREDIGASLEALKTNYVDVWYFHRDDPTLPVEEIMEMVYPYVEKGQIRYLGCSNWTAKRIRDANRYAYRNSLAPFVVSQIHWSLAETTPQQWGDSTLVCMNKEEYDFYEMTRIPVIAFASQAKGYYAKGVPFGYESLSEKAKKRFDSPANRARMPKVQELADRCGVSAAAIAVSYLTSNSLVAAALIGCSSVSQLENTMQASDVRLNREILDWLYGK